MNNNNNKKENEIKTFTSRLSYVTKTIYTIIKASAFRMHRNERNGIRNL